MPEINKKTSENEQKNVFLCYVSTLKTAEKKKIDQFLGAHGTQKLVQIHNISLLLLLGKNSMRNQPHAAWL